MDPAAAAAAAAACATSADRNNFPESGTVVLLAVETDSLLTVETCVRLSMSLRCPCMRLPRGNRDCGSCLSEIPQHLELHPCGRSCFVDVGIGAHVDVRNHSGNQPANR